MAKKEKIDSPGNKKTVFQLIKKGFTKLDDELVKRVFTKEDLKKYRDAVKRGDDIPLAATEDFGSSIRKIIGTETEYDKNKKKKK